MKAEVLAGIEVNVLRAENLPYSERQKRIAGQRRYHYPCRETIRVAPVTPSIGVVLKAERAGRDYCDAEVPVRLDRYQLKNAGSEREVSGAFTWKSSENSPGQFKPCADLRSRERRVVAGERGRGPTRF
jgi:hypothetical protein